MKIPATTHVKCVLYFQTTLNHHKIPLFKWNDSRRLRYTWRYRYYANTQQY